MSFIPYEIITHKRQVCSLYKKACRTIEDWYHYRPLMRIKIVRLRKRFDDNKNIIDVPTAQELLKKGQHELWANQHYYPHQFPSSPGGTAFDRDCFPPDWVLDSWHPLEKAQYPKYFAKREERKKEYIALWEKRWGKPFIPHDEH
ncbi:hypothetical protein ACI65C_007314 [Semiaphis heraclei]